MISDRLSAVLSMVQSMVQSMVLSLDLSMDKTVNTEKAVSMEKTMRVLADIGTDHAYVPVAACLRGLTQRAIACDINPGPLAKAVRNINAYQLAHRIETRLGDGLAPLAVGEADCIVIAGMGGMRIADILAGAPETAHAARGLVLQPQHDIPRLRRILHAQGFDITDELMLREDGHFYTVLAAKSHIVGQRQTVGRAAGQADGHTDEQVDGQTGEQADGHTGKQVDGQAKCWSETEYLLGRHLLLRRDPVLYAFLQHEMVKLTGYIDGIMAQSSEQASMHASARKQPSERVDPLRTRLMLYKEVWDAWQ